VKDNNEIGYTKEEYYQISAKQGLPTRCPILRNCLRAFETRHKMVTEFNGGGIPFEEFLRSLGETRSPDTMIKSAEQRPSCLVGGAVTAMSNVCPEVMLFESEYLPREFRQSAFANASYYDDSLRIQAEPKHYRECAEFAEFSFCQKGRRKVRDANLSRLTQQIPERALEDYLENHLEELEPGLKLLKRQKRIGKWKADIFASDSAGVDVLIELKSKAMNRDDADKLCGQVSRYYNHLKSDTRDLRVFIVIPRNNNGITDNLYHGLKPWIENNKVTVFQFDYSLYGREFTFSRLDFAKH